MKKILAILLIMIFILSLTSCAPNEELEFKEVDGGVMVVGIGGYKGTELEIPDTYNSKKVVAIGDNAFRYCKDLKSVTIPEGVTSIGNLAFAYCSSLETINLPESLVSIGWCAFSFCSFENLQLPSNLETIGSAAFESCDRLSSIAIPNKVKIIEDRTFYECRSLKNIELPNDITCIGHEAFRTCAITTITIPNTVEGIGYNAFYWCFNLKEIHYMGTKEEWEDLGGRDYFHSSKYSFNLHPTIYCVDGDIKY